MTKIKLLFLAILLISGSLLFLPHLPKPAYSQVSPSYGEPLQGLTDEELRLFRIGQEDFEEIREINDGLGPGFNARSCAECHSTPATGGASAMSVVRFGSLTGEVFDGLESLGGSLLQLFAIRTRCQARIPPQANVIARRLTLPIFGDGLIESIPDDDILATAKSQTEDMRGRAHLINDLATKTRRVGRFGWKAVHATLLSFSADAYLNEMGITSRFLPDDRPPNGDMVLLAE
ncbi:MAG: hypothetical protein HYR55_20820, partial [Acidobacteria bacterium]|nr:hypothetical protein [Acidobacteriota bacterium]